MEVKEAEFRAWFVKHLKSKGWFAKPVENTTSRGTPDVYVCKHGHSAWVELKVGKPLLRPEQNVFGFQHRCAGGSTLLLTVDREVLWCWSAPFVNVELKGKLLLVKDRPEFSCHPSRVSEELIKLISL